MVPQEVATSMFSLAQAAVDAQAVRARADAAIATADAAASNNCLNCGECAGAASAVTSPSKTANVGAADDDALSADMNIPANAS